MSSPGWYPDPDNSLQQRYWDGSKWTAQIRMTAGGADSWRSPAVAVTAAAGNARVGSPPKSNIGWLIAGGVAILVLFGACSSSDVLWRMGVDGSGYNVTCMDGTHSKSGGNHGACSQHGGVK